MSETDHKDNIESGNNNSLNIAQRETSPQPEETNLPSVPV